MPRDAFISHSTKDGAQLAESLCAGLEVRGLRCWIAPRDVAWDSSYGPAIDAAIGECGVFVLLMTPEAEKSPEVGREAQLATRHRTRMIPISVDGAEPGPNLRYYIAGWQYFRCPRVPDDADIDRLASAIRGAPAPAPPLNHTPAPENRSWRTRYLVPLAGSVVAALALAIYFAIGAGLWNRPSNPPAETPIERPDESKTPPQEKQGERQSLPRPTPPEERSAATQGRHRDEKTAEAPSKGKTSMTAVDNSDALVVNQALLGFVSIPGVAFQMSATEVTQDVWQEVMEDNPSDFKGNRLPVHNVAWKDALAFIDRLNERSDGYKYRLPTETEWEYAAKANESALPDLETTAWLGLAADPARAGVQWVATKSANRWKLSDMFGNVAEWCESADDASSHQRVTRGGSWMDSVASLQKSDRLLLAPSTRNYTVGVRLVRSPSK